MASMIDELIDVLKAEEAEYRALIPISEEKTRALISNDMQALQSVTDREQTIVDKAVALGNHREEVIQNIGMVLGKEPKDLNIVGLISLLAKQPEEQKRLSLLHDSLKSVMNRLVEVNETNRDLLENSLDMIQFNMNLIRSSGMSAANNNYDKNAGSAGSVPDGFGAGSFDAKQ